MNLRMKLQFTFLFLVAPLLSVAQVGHSWTTFGGDPQRTGWAKGETELTKANIKGLKLEWSLKLDNTSKELNSLTVPIVRGPLITAKGFKELVLVAGASDKLYAIDADTGLDGLVVAAGFSGHGFGIGPVTGEILADLALSRRPRFDLSPFRLSRFAGGRNAPAELTLHG